MPIPISQVLAEVDQLNAMCRKLRNSFLQHHPDAPRTQQELEYVEILRQCQQAQDDKT